MKVTRSVQCGPYHHDQDPLELCEGGAIFYSQEGNSEYEAFPYISWPICPDVLDSINLLYQHDYPGLDSSHCEMILQSFVNADLKCPSLLGDRAHCTAGILLRRIMVADAVGCCWLCSLDTMAELTMVGRRLFPADVRFVVLSRKLVSVPLCCLLLRWRIFLAHQSFAGPHATLRLQIGAAARSVIGTARETHAHGQQVPSFLYHLHL